MIRLATADEPDVLCLQEVPVWALSHLAGWSGMQSFGAVAARPLVRGAIGREVTELNQGRIRSALVGQANAILLRPGLRVLATDSIVLNPPSFRHRIDRELHLPARVQWRWLRHRRVVHAVRTSEVTVANLHGSATHNWAVADAELLRAATFAE